MPPRLAIRRPLHLLSNPHTSSRPFSLPSLPSLSDLTPSAQPHTLHATRHLPYPSPFLYHIISDIASYSSFLPFCTTSTVHSFVSPPSTPDLKLPSRATLHISGWGAFSESYTSRVYCLPSSTVEAVSGDADTELDPTLLAELGYSTPGRDGDADGGGDKGLFKSLVTRWTVSPIGKEARETAVELRVRFLFHNPVHQFAVRQSGERIADVMVGAFERRATELWERQGNGRIYHG